MQATVVSVDPDARAGKWPVTKLTVQTENGERNYNIFKKMACHSDVVKLQPGQTIDLKMEKKGQYWNVVDVDVVESASTPSVPNSGRFNSEKDKEIRRAVALKAAIELVAGTLTSKSDLDAAARTAVMLSPIFEPYLESGTTDDAVANYFEGDDEE